MLRYIRTLLLCLTMLAGWPAAATAQANYEAGVIAYESGEYARALKEFRPLAAQGVSDAEFMLGAMYFYGNGVVRNDAFAAIWFHRAAQQGNAKAQLAFGSLHIRGLGVRQDLVKAYMWLSLAADSEVSGLMQQAILLRSDAAWLMTREEIETAQRRLEAWTPRPAGFAWTAR